MVTREYTHVEKKKVEKQLNNAQISLNKRVDKIKYKVILLLSKRNLSLQSN